MVLEHYLSDLLYRYNCVVVPGFGAFLTQKKSARINSETNTFYAPCKSISFNGQLKSNDGLLINYIAESEGLSFEDTQYHIEKIVQDWTESLAKKKSIHLKNIGVLTSNNEGRFLFEPQTNTNYLTSSFGLTNFNAPSVLREVLKEEVLELEEKIPFVISPERRTSTGFRPYLKYAAILLLAFSTGLSGYRFYTQRNTNEQVALQDAQDYVTKEIQEATFFDLSPLELPTVNVNAKTILNKTNLEVKHHIVAGAFRVKANAERKISQLKSKGYNAAYFGTNAYGLHMVTYDRFADSKEALIQLREIKRTQSSDAWLLSQK